VGGNVSQKLQEDFSLASLARIGSGYMSIFRSKLDENKLKTGDI
jgi:hypothetical protein